MKVDRPSEIPAQPVNAPLFTGGPVTRQTLLTLTTDAVFLKEMRRVDELIKATDSIRPAPPELVKFWELPSL